MGETARGTIKLLALLAALTLCVSSLPPSVEAGKQRGRARQVAPGVWLRLYRLKGQGNKVRVVSFGASAKPTVDVVLATNRLAGREPVSSMARRTGAIAAINGDYSRPSGRPVHSFARDGRLDQRAAMVPQTGLEIYGRNFAVDEDKRNVYLTHPKTRAWLWVPEQQASHRVERMNDRSIQSDAKLQIRAFTTVGEKDERPPLGGCYLRLRARGKPRSASPTHAPTNRGGASIAPAGVERDYVVETNVCRYKRVLPDGGVTLYTPQNGIHAETLRSMPVGTSAVFGWSLGWPGVFDTVGGNPTLIENGSVQKQSIYGGSSFVSGRHPRTAVAYNARTNRLFFVTVDGRQPKYSRGMTLAGLTHFLRKRLGATDALNLDGGGSTTMVVKGKVRGRPSDGSQRAVSSALVVLPGTDPGESLAARSDPARAPLFSNRDVSRAATAYDEMSRDPASVGGLAAWLDGGGRGLPGFLKRTAADFRSARHPVTD